MAENGEERDSPIDSGKLSDLLLKNGINVSISVDHVNGEITITHSEGKRTDLQNNQNLMNRMKGIIRTLPYYKGEMRT